MIATVPSWTPALAFAVFILGAYQLTLSIRRQRARKRGVGVLVRQAEDHAFVHTKPTAYVLELADNGPSGWKYLVWDYDPDQRRLQAGQVEGILVPRGMRGGYPNDKAALLAGIDAIRLGGWDGDILFRAKV